jgi:hypothetical protein
VAAPVNASGPISRRKSSKRVQGGKPNFNTLRILDCKRSGKGWTLCYQVRDLTGGIEHHDFTSKFMNSELPTTNAVTTVNSTAFSRSHPRLVPMNTQGYLAIPQAWFSTGDAKPARDLMRDLERVNRGEP